MLYGLLAAQLSSVPQVQDSKAVQPKNSKVSLDEILIQIHTDDPNAIFVSGLDASLDLKVDMDRNLIPLIRETQDREKLEAMNGEW